MLKTTNTGSKWCDARWYARYLELARTGSWKLFDSWCVRVCSCPSSVRSANDKREHFCISCCWSKHLTKFSSKKVVVIDAHVSIIVNSSFVFLHNPFIHSPHSIHPFHLTLDRFYRGEALTKSSHCICGHLGELTNTSIFALAVVEINQLLYEHEQKNIA